jgi:hypothetical protein
MVSSVQRDGIVRELLNNLTDGQFSTMVHHRNMQNSRVSLQRYLTSLQKSGECRNHTEKTMLTAVRAVQGLTKRFGVSLVNNTLIDISVSKGEYATSGVVLWIRFEVVVVDGVAGYLVSTRPSSGSNLFYSRANMQSPAERYEQLVDDETGKPKEDLLELVTRIINDHLPAKYNPLPAPTPELKAAKISDLRQKETEAVEELITLLNKVPTPATEIEDSD